MSKQISFPILMLAALRVSAPLAAASCEQLASLALPKTTISAAQQVPAGPFTPPNGKALIGLPAFCRVAGTIRPSGDSNIEFEVWLPAAGWNGKFQGIGNGGYAGEIGYGGLAAALSRGYATAGTDTGHKAKGGGVDATWALDHREKIIDFGYRGIHETAVAAKAVVRAFYGNGPRKSYFSSCSNGGRQALMEAQRFPEDYDGIVAGAPANFWTHHLSGFIWNAQALTESAGSFIPPGKLAAMEAAALASCDASDGVKDGVIGDPSKCKVDAEKLLCTEAESDQCLTAAQVKALKKIYEGPRTSQGRQIFPGYAPGGETGRGGWAAWITGPEPEKSLQFLFGTQFGKNMVFSKADWDYKTFDWDRDIQVADDRMAKILNSTDPDLKRFRARGGKLILYHGWSDAAIPPENTVQYFESVRAKLGTAEMGSFARLFMVPGMQHCGGGPGPNSFGQSGLGAAGDAGHDIDAALESWVESGIAPERIVAVKYASDKPESGALRTRPLCAYPRVERYKGSGSTDEAANFECVAP